MKTQFYNWGFANFEQIREILPGIKFSEKEGTLECLEVELGTILILLSSRFDVMLVSKDNVPIIYLDSKSGRFRAR